MAKTNQPGKKPAVKKAAGKAATTKSANGAGTAKKPTPSQAQGFDKVKAAIQKHGDKLRSIKGVVDLRPGYKFTGGWITPTPAIVVYVRRKLDRKEVPQDRLIPRSIGGVKVDVVPATPSQIKAADGLSIAGDIDGAGETEDLALPGWNTDGDDDEGPEAGLSMAAAERQPYEPPPEVELSEFKEGMKVTCHVSPDEGWNVLGDFLSRTKRSLTIGMYDFTAPHIIDQLQTTMSASNRSLHLILDPGMSITGSTKANDKPEDEMKELLGEALGKRFKFVWAPVGRRKVSVPIFPTAYHIKVAVRDKKSFWLSSGNLQSSNQPNRDVLDLSIKKLLSRYNREWHVIIEHTGLAGTYEQFLNWDFKQAKPLQIPPQAAGPQPAATQDSVELMVPEALLAAAEAEVTEPDYEAVKSFEFTADKPLRVQPLLTPDNFAEHVLKVIRSAKQRLYFQNQYIKVGKVMGKKFKSLLDALFSKISAGIEVRIILRDLPKQREVLEALQFYAAQNHGIEDISPYIKIQPGCHTKGIIVDSKVVVVGSHNWSDQGVTHNRDASLIFFNKDIAQFYERVFLYDWDHLARTRLITEAAVAAATDEDGLAAAGGEENGYVAVPWDMSEDID
jgi:hypothetical protein